MTTTTRAAWAIERLEAALAPHDIRVQTYSAAAWALLPMTAPERESGWANLAGTPRLTAEELPEYDLRVCPELLERNLAGLELGAASALHDPVRVNTVDGRARLIAFVVMQQFLGIDGGGDPTVAAAFALITLDEQPGTDRTLVFR